MDVDDIESLFYGNGTMVLPWALGNDDRQVKKGTKSYRLIIAADIEDLCSGVSRMFVHAEVFPVPRNALDAPRGATLLLGLWRMYCMQLGDFRDYLVQQNAKFQFRVPDVNPPIDQPARRSVGRRVNLSFSTLEAHHSEFGEMTFEEFQRIHEDRGADGPTEGETMSSPAAEELDFVSLFDAQLREQKIEKRRRTRNARGGFREELPDDDLITMLRSNQNIVTDVSRITLTEAEPYVPPPGAQRPDEEFGVFGDEEMAAARPPSLLPEVAALPDEEAGIGMPMDVQETSTVDPVMPHVGLVTEPLNPEDVPEVTTRDEGLGPIRVPSAKRVAFSDNRRSEDTAQAQSAKRKRSKTPAGFMQDAELVLSTRQLRERQNVPIPTYEELLQKARSLRNFQPRLSTREKNKQARLSIYTAQGIPLGKTLQDFVDQLHEPEMRRLLRPKSARNRISTVPVEAPPDPVQDEVDRNINVLADDHPEPRQSVATEIQTSAPEINTGSPSAAFTSNQITSTTPGTTLGAAITTDNCSTRGTTLGLSTTPGTTAGVLAVGDERSTIGTVRGESTTPMVTSDAQITFSIQHTPTRVEASGLDSHAVLENVFEMEHPAPEEILIDNGTAEAGCVSPENLPYKTFRELFPPGTTSRQKAAFEFQRLLKLQAEKKVLLIQHEFCGDIWIKPLD